MKYLAPIITFLLSMTLFTGCEKVLLGEAEENTPENNFEIFWNDFDHHYGLFEARGWNWDSIYLEQRGLIAENTTEEELWNSLKEMIAYLDDSHTFIFNPNQNDFFVSGAENDDQVESEFSLDVIGQNYVDNLQLLPGTPEDEELLYGNVRGKDIGYIYLSGIDLQDPDDFDQVIAEIGNHAAIILDIRNNGGGSDLIAAEIAGRFADGEHFVYTVEERNGPDHEDFGPKIPYSTQVRGSEHFDKPLIVLTDEITVSAAEVLLFYLKAFEQVTQLGTATSGDFSDTGMRRFLPNGWQYQYSIMQFLQPDGTSLDGVGHVPDIYARNAVTDIAAGNDLVIERAFEFLFEEYGIE